MKLCSKFFTSIIALFLFTDVICTNVQIVHAAGTDISSTNVTSLTVDTTTIEDGGNVNITANFASNTEHKIVSGDTINISWDSDTAQGYFIQGYTKTVDLTVAGTVVGNAVITVTGATITFNDAVDNLDNVMGYLTFETMGRNISTTEESTKTVNITVGSKSVAVNIHKSADGTDPASFYYKTGNMFPEDTTHVQWWLSVNNNKEILADDIVLSDSIQTGQTLDPSTFNITVDQQSLYSGTAGMASFVADTGSTFSYDATNGTIQIKMPHDYASGKSIVISYKTTITDNTAKTFANNSSITYQIENKDSVTESSNYSVNNINASAGITGTVRAELKIAKVVNNTKIGIPNVEFELKRTDGAVIENNQTVITLTTDSKGIAGIKNLPAGEYQVKETSAPSWISFDGNNPYTKTFTVSDTDIEGTLLNVPNNKLKIDITAYKAWVNDNVTARPTIYFKLYRQIGDAAPEAVPGAEIKNLANMVTSVTWTNMDQSDDTGATYTYSVKEVDSKGNDYVPAGYTKSEKGLTVTNTKNVTGTVDVPVTKIWSDSSDQDGKRPSSVTFQLVKQVEGGQFTDVIGQSITLTAADKDSTDSNKWKHTFTGLPEYEGGKKITYSVRETSIDKNYEAIVNELSITNILKTYECQIEKKDISENNYVLNALLAVTDADGKVYDTWYSDKTSHKLYLPIGNYTLTELKAPTGYTIATPIDFKIDADGKITSESMYNGILVMKDKKTTSTPKTDNPNSSKTYIVPNTADKN